MSGTRGSTGCASMPSVRRHGPPWLLTSWLAASGARGRTAGWRLDFVLGRFDQGMRRPHGRLRDQIFAVKVLTHVHEPALDVTTKTFDGSLAKHGETVTVVHLLLCRGHVIPPLQTMNSPIAEIRQRDRKAATSRRRL